MNATLNEVRYGSLLAEYRPRPIHDEEESERAIALLERLSAESDPECLTLAEILTTLVEEFERERCALPSATPLEILHELLEANGIDRKDFAEIVAGKRFRNTQWQATDQPLFSAPARQKI